MREMSKRSRLKRLLFWGISFTISGLILFAGMELMLRVLINKTFTAEVTFPLVHSAIPGLGYQLAPDHSSGSIRTDSNGLRLRPPDSAPVRYKILLIGDSISFGSGVPYEKSFAPVLEANLTAELGQTTAVWNAGVPGYNTDQESITLDRIGPFVKPDLVVVQFCMNDYLDPPQLTSGGTLDATKTEGNSGFSFMALAYHSRVFVFVKEKFKELQQARPEWFPVWAHYIHYIQRRPGWERAKRALLHIQETAKELNATVLLVIFPVEQQLRIGDRAAQDDLVGFARFHQIAVLDLYPVFRSHWRDGLYVNYWKEARVVDKLHLNERGHALVARAIASTIVGQRNVYLSAQQELALPVTLPVSTGSPPAGRHGQSSVHVLEASRPIISR
jgi:lysophospholipase L1-like esterase